MTTPKIDFKVQHPKADFSTGGVPREKSFRECFAPLRPSDAEKVPRKNRQIEFMWSNLTPAVNRQPGFRREDS